MIPNSGLSSLRRYSYALWAMGRPLFLMGTLPLYLLGVSAARHDGLTVLVPETVLGLCLVWSVQLLTHYSNEYYDLETDLVNDTSTLISGGSRVLVDRLVPRSTARIAAIASLLAAIILAATLAVATDAGAWVMAFAGAAIFLGWFYSTPPLKLESRGLGEIAIIIASCWLVPYLSYYLQGATLSPKLVITVIPLSLLTLALTLATGILDRRSDRAGGKWTLAVRLGKTGARWLLGVSLVAGWLIFGVVMIYLWPAWGWVSWAVSGLLLAAGALSMRIPGRRPTAPTERLGLTIAWLLGYSAASFSIAFLFS